MSLSNSLKSSLNNYKDNEAKLEKIDSNKYNYEDIDLSKNVEKIDKKLAIERKGFLSSFCNFCSQNWNDENAKNNEYMKTEYVIFTRGNSQISNDSFNLNNEINSKSKYENINPFSNIQVNKENLNNQSFLSNFSNQKNKANKSIVDLINNDYEEYEIDLNSKENSGFFKKNLHF